MEVETTAASEGTATIEVSRKIRMAGKPFNIASYALLLHTLGDAHIYLNHMEQVEKQLARTPKPLPQLRITRDVSSLFDFRYDDFEITGYDPDPGIRAPVAV